MPSLRRLAVVVVLVVLAGVNAHGFRFEEASIDAIRLGFRNGSLTSTALVIFYLDRIARFNPLLRAVIEVNPDALTQAARADADRRRRSGSGSMGGLHGIPVLLKDNIATRDALNTTAGSLALLGSVVRRDAGVVARLRRAGAVVLGKANPTEWSAFRSVDNGWSARGGQSLVSAPPAPKILSFLPESGSIMVSELYRAESLRAVGGPVRVERRAGRGGGGEPGGGDAGQRDRRLHTLPFVLELCRRD